MKVNGKQIKLTKSLSLKEYLEQEGYVLLRVAVEKNGQIIPRADFAAVMLCDEDSLEIVSFVGGG